MIFANMSVRMGCTIILPGVTLTGVKVKVAVTCRAGERSGKHLELPVTVDLVRKIL